MNEFNHGDSEPPSADDLRRQAESRWSQTADAMTEADVRALVHELQVHQIELEMQNEALHESQRRAEAYRDRYIDLYDFAPLAYITLDHDGHVHEINLAGAKMLRKPRSELTGYSFVRHVVEPDQRDFLARVRKCCDENAEIAWESRLLVNQGEIIQAEIRAVPWQGHEHDGVFCRIAITDVTPLKRAEAAIRDACHNLEKRVEERTAQLQQSAAEILDLYNHAPCGYHSLGPDGTFLRINETELDWLGYSREEVVGRLTFLDILTPKSRLVFQENFTGFMERGWVKDLEFELVRKDGSILLALLNATAVRDAEGNFLKSRSTIFDITERKRKDAVFLRQSRLSLAIEQVLEKALLCDSNEQLWQPCLTIVEELTQSKFGFIGEINAAGRLDTVAVSDPGWEACRMPMAETVASLQDTEIRGIYTGVLREGRSMIVNEPTSHPDWLGPPAGHTALLCFLGVPLQQDGKTIGLIGVANKEGGYTVEDLEDLEQVSAAILETILRKRAEMAARKKTADMENLYKAMLGREKRGIELKEEVNRLCEELNREPAYPPVWKSNATDAKKADA